MTPGIDRQVLRWRDTEKIDGFVNWTSAKHPEFGKVEIGGFKPYAVTNPPPAKLAELGGAHAKFAVYLASLFPRAKVAAFEAVGHGGGIFRLKAEIENAGFWPTSLAHGQTARAGKPTMVQLGGDPGAVISGSAKTSFLPVLSGSGTRAKYEWLILGCWPQSQSSIDKKTCETGRTLANKYLQYNNCLVASETVEKAPPLTFLL